MKRQGQFDCLNGAMIELVELDVLIRHNLEVLGYGE